MRDETEEPAGPANGGAENQDAGGGADAVPAGGGAATNSGDAGGGAAGGDAVAAAGAAEAAANAAGGDAGANAGANAGGGRGGNGGGTRTLSLDTAFDTPPERFLDLDEVAGAVGVDSGTFLQRSGVKLFYWVLTVTALVVLALFISLYVEMSSLPTTPSGQVLTSAFQRGDTVQTQRLAEHYRAVSEVAVAQRDSAWAHFVLGVKELIVTVFFPLLTGILGYIFGTRSESVQTGRDQDSGAG